MTGTKHRFIWMLTGALLLGIGLVAFGIIAPPSVNGPNAGNQAVVPIQGSVAVIDAQGSISLTNLEEQFVNLYNVVNPAVVSIQVAEEIGFGQGSGFVYDTQGHIVTNHHVAGDAAEIFVIFADGSNVAAELVGSDPDTDLAVIKVDPTEAPALIPLPVGDSEAMQVGQMVIAIGNPFGLSGTMTMGIISAKGRTLPSQHMSIDGQGTFSTPNIIQTDAAINPGNSGGPLLNLAGEVVGVNSAIRTQTGENSGVGFAIPSSIIARVVPSLVQRGVFEHPWLGISGRTMDPITSELMGLPENQRGVLVATISSGSPAQKGGLIGSNEEAIYEELPVAIGGDVIVTADGQTILEFDDLLEFLADNTVVGQTITLGVLRDGQSLELAVTLAPRP
ncbi:S1C family serine protease [Chloroflexota bacterium]